MNNATYFRDIYTRLLDTGHEVSPRGLTIIESENFTYELPPYVRFTNFKERKLNLDYIKREFLWYLNGDKYDVSICNYAKIWKDIVNSDGSINSNYGQYLFGEINQFECVINTLKKDRESRRASIMILQPKHLLMETKDVPCTYSINFRIRDDKLNMSVRMRSQDAIFGFSNDCPAFSFIHEMVYVCLAEHYVGLKLGSYNHMCDSFHVYERHYDMINKLVLPDSKFDNIYCPEISCGDEVRFLIRGDYSSGIPEKYNFTQWLNEVNA